MCGIAGILGPAAERAGDDVLRRMAQRLVHRGPDGEGFWRGAGAALAHRRLSVLDPSEAGAQPMARADGSGVLVYNGELYNDHELREELVDELGTPFRSDCDTETVVEALGRWGLGALERFRGMFALAFVADGKCVLARDPLGIKPLCVASVDGGVVIASDPRAILEHPAISAEPDPAAVSAYLTTIRTTMGPRTMLAGIETLLPGEVRVYDLASGRECEPRRWLPAVREGGAGETRGVIESSIRAHLRSDVPLCSLLSGGLDSSVVASVVRGETDRLRTYCAGDPGSGPDFAFAREVADHLGVEHTEVAIDASTFGRVWGELIAHNALPLSTPNEVAICEVARSLRATGDVVALSGEGADELLAGYELPMQAALAHVRERAHENGGLYQLRAHAWVGPEVKPGLLDGGFWARAEGDSILRAHYAEQFELARAEVGVGDPLEAHLRLHRRINLTGLLGRLDSSTMIASVEGRTPFADVGVASHAGRLSMDRKCAFDEGGSAVRTKIALREAFAGDLPASVVARPKASFPLPFQSWIAGESASIRSSGFLPSVFTGAAIEAVASNPGGLWSLAWPMANLARWGRAMGWAG